MAIGSTVGKAVSSGMRFRKAFTISLVMIVFLIIFLNFFVILFDKEDGGMDKAVNYMGNKFLAPNYELNNESLKIINNGGAYLSTNESVWGRYWENFKTYSNLLSAIIIIVLWTKFFSYLLAHSPFSNTSNAFINIVGAFLLINFAQMLVLALQDKAISTPWVSYWNFIKAMPYLIKPVASVVDSGSQNITDACPIGNITNGSCGGL